MQLICNFKRILFCALLATFIFTIPAQGLPWSPNDIDPIWRANAAQITASFASYDRNEDIFTSTTTSLSSENLGNIFPFGVGAALATDIVGTISITAKIDGSGELLGGSFVWTGSSETLGIATGTPLITATITDFYYDDDVNIKFQFRARVDTISPALAAHTGPIQSLLINDFVDVGPDFFVDPWNADFSGSGLTTSPDVYMSPNVLPVFPLAEALTEFSVAHNSAQISSYNATTDIYNIGTPIGTNAVSARIFNTAEFSSIASDVTSDLSMQATVDENGDVSAGSLIWKGKIPSLGITFDEVFIEGEVVEAKYSDSGISVFVQFLVLVTELHPDLERVLGDVKTLVITDYQIPFLWNFDPWGSSFSDAPYTFSPDIWGTTQTLMNSDSDGDGIANLADNCVSISNGAQRDADSDGIGTACDTDLNNDCIVNFLDISRFADSFLTSDENADFNGDGSVNFVDYTTLADQFLVNYLEQNPSTAPNICDSGNSLRRK